MRQECVNLLKLDPDEKGAIAAINKLCDALMQDYNEMQDDGDIIVQVNDKDGKNLVMLRNYLDYVIDSYHLDE